MDHIDYGGCGFVRTLGIFMIAIIASSLILRFGWLSIIPTTYLGLASLLLIFGKLRAFLIAIGIFILIGFIMPIMDPARPAIHRMICRDNMKKIASAIREYESSHGVLPLYVSSEEGVPLFSWRVLLLPYIGEKELFEKLDLTKPWNHPVNLEIGARMPILFRCPESRYESKWRTVGTMTSYVAILRSPTSRPSSAVIRSEDSNPRRQPMLIVESAEHQTHWMSPSDPTINEFLASTSLNKRHGGLVHVVASDGEIIVFPSNEALGEMREFLTIGLGNDR